MLMMTDFFPDTDPYVDEEIEGYGVAEHSNFPGWEVFYVVTADSDEEEPCTTFPCDTVLVMMEYETE